MRKIVTSELLVTQHFRYAPFKKILFFFSQFKQGGTYTAAILQHVNNTLSHKSASDIHRLTDKLHVHSIQSKPVIFFT